MEKGTNIRPNLAQVSSFPISLGSHPGNFPSLLEIRHDEKKVIALDWRVNKRRRFSVESEPNKYNDIFRAYRNDEFSYIYIYIYIYMM